jgi:hypothetical protein
MKTEAGDSSETYDTTRRHIPEDSNVYMRELLEQLSAVCSPGKALKDSNVYMRELLEQLSAVCSPGKALYSSPSYEGPNGHSLRLRHTSGRQPCGRKLPRVQRDGDFGSHPVLKMEPSNFLMMT